MGQSVGCRGRAGAKYERGEFLSRERVVRRCRGVCFGKCKHAIAQLERPDARFAFNRERERLAEPLGACRALYRDQEVVIEPL